MKTLRVELATPYDILIGRGILSSLGELISARLPSSSRIALISDETVDAIYGEVAENSLSKEGFSVARLSFPGGEANKTMATVESLLVSLMQAELTRTDLIVALGGGIVGDVVGFVAASYLRGIRFVQVPTTLLAAVDSSVGGKTGVNLLGAKNQVGAFWQPSLVVCDPDTFRTLTPSQYADGMSEAVKYGVAFDTSLFELIMREHDVVDVIERSLAIKASVVAEDEHDNGRRQLLNFGHTVGHAIEHLTNGEVTHGHAVAIGMVYVTRAAERLGFSEKISERLISCLVKNCLPTDTDLPVEAILEAVRHDKKRRGDEISLVLPRRLGRAELFAVSMGALREVLL